MRIKSQLRELVSSSLSIFRNKSKKGHRCLMYHSIGSNVIGDNNGLNSLSEKYFLQHVEFLKNFKLVSACSENLNYEQLNLSLTFDDGYEDNLKFVAPILVKNNIPFTVFVTTDFIVNKNNCMDINQLRELSMLDGVTVGSHTKSHCHLTKLDDKELKKELEYSKLFIEDVIGNKVESISYPNGDVNLRVAKKAKYLGYKHGFCSHFDINLNNRNKLLLNRSFIHKNEGINILKQKISGDWDWFKHRYTDPNSIK